MKPDAQRWEGQSGCRKTGNNPDVGKTEIIRMQEVEKVVSGIYGYSSADFRLGSVNCTYDRVLLITYVIMVK